MKVIKIGVTVFTLGGAWFWKQPQGALTCIGGPYETPREAFLAAPKVEL